MRARGAAALVVGCVVLTGCPAAATAAAPSTPTVTRVPVGGPLLTGRRVVVDPLPGAPALPKPSQLPASSWLVADLTTGQVLAAKAPHQRFLPASTLKTLTAVTLLPELSATRRVRATEADAAIDGSRVGLVPMMRYTVAKLFAAMLVVSANDAAEALADAAGGVRTTLAAMNAEAHLLQADDTVARTPSGLDGKGESTSAYDLALIGRAAIDMPAFRHYAQIVHTTVPAPHHKHFDIYTHNRLLTSYRGDLGGKNGYTVAAMGTYWGAATRGGHTILVSLMHANPYFWPMATSLLDWGFKAVGHVRPVGTLVHPLVPSTTPAHLSTGAAARPAQLGALHRAASGALLSRPEWLLLLVTAAVLAVGVVDRGRRQRRRRVRVGGLPGRLR